MSRILDLLKLPSMKYSYIAAGLNGAYNFVKKISILETPFPQVEEFLYPGEFTFSSFWSMKTDPDNRVKLVESMIKHKCAGIGIMPGPNLNDEIDRGIIDLANQHGFPVIYIPTHVRWSDVISEFSLVSNPNINLDLDSHLREILSLFSDLRSEKDLQKFCTQLNRALSLPIIINTDHIYFNGIDDKTVSSIMSKIYCVKMQELYKTNMPITLNIDNQNVAVAFYGNNSVLATYTDSQNVTHSLLEIFNRIAPFIIKELDNMVEKIKDSRQIKTPALDKDSSYFLGLLRKDSIHTVSKHLEENYIVYEKNAFYNYMIILIPAKCETMNIYNEYRKIIESTHPLLFVFSTQSCDLKEFYNQIKILKHTIGPLLFLNGIFSIDELPLLNMVLYSPREFKQKVFQINSAELNLEVEQSFFDTLRLYLVLRNINSVSSLLGIHSNSVKYRISKCFETPTALPLSSLSDLPNIKLMILLEILKIEGFSSDCFLTGSALHH